MIAKNVSLNTGGRGGAQKSVYIRSFCIRYNYIADGILYLLFRGFRRQNFKIRNSKTVDHTYIVGCLHAQCLIFLRWLII